MTGLCLSKPHNPNYGWFKWNVLKLSDGLIRCIFWAMTISTGTKVAPRRHERRLEGRPTVAEHSEVQLTSCFFKPPEYPFSGPNSGKRGAQCFRRFLVWTCRMWSTGLRSKVGVSQLCLKRVWKSLFLWTWKCFISWDMPLLLWHCRIQDDPIRTLFEASPLQRKLCLLAPGTICQWSSARHLLVRLLRSYGSKTCQRTNG